MGIHKKKVRKKNKKEKQKIKSISYHNSLFHCASRTHSARRRSRRNAAYGRNVSAIDKEKPAESDSGTGLAFRATPNPLK